MKLTDESHLTGIRENNKLYCLLTLSLHGSGPARSGEMELRSSACATTVFCTGDLACKSQVRPARVSGRSILPC